MCSSDLHISEEAEGKPGTKAVSVTCEHVYGGRDPAFFEILLVRSSDYAGV